MATAEIVYLTFRTMALAFAIIALIRPLALIPMFACLAIVYASHMHMRKTLAPDLEDQP